MSKLGNLALDGEDPRLHNEKEHEQETFDVPPEYSPGATRPQHRNLHDAGVTFEEYMYYAKRTRVEEDNLPRPERESGILSIIFPSKSDGGVKQETENASRDGTDMNTSDPANRMTISDEEWANASRALRTASRGAIFYLITTDILGPFGLPYAFATMGWG